MADGSAPTAPRLWSVAEAKAKFSQVVDRALNEGPQRISRRGKDTVVVVSEAEWSRREQPRMSLLEFFQRSPLWGSGIVFGRAPGGPRDLDL